MTEEEFDALSLSSRQAGVQYRKPCEAPTEPGWYYGRYFSYDLTPRNVVIIPVEVVSDEAPDPRLYVLDCGEVFELKDYTGFGPVPTIQEG